MLTQFGLACYTINIVHVGPARIGQRAILTSMSATRNLTLHSLLKVGVALDHSRPLKRLDWSDLRQRSWASVSSSATPLV